jgi:hypothetical protein
MTLPYAISKPLRSACFSDERGAEASIWIYGRLHQERSYARRHDDHNDWRHATRSKSNECSAC